MSGERSSENARPGVPSLRSVVEHPRYTLRNLVVFAGGVSLSVFLLSFAVARDGGVEGGYLRTLETYIVLVGTFWGLVAISWAAKFHVGIWRDLERCFAISDEAYREIVDPVLERAYSGRRIAVEFLLVLVVLGTANVLFVPVPWAIAPERLIGYFLAILDRDVCLAVYAGTCIDYFSVINYLHGSVVLFVLVAGGHLVTYFLVLTHRMTEVPLNDVGLASERLQPIAQLGIYVSTNTFLGALLVSIVYALNVERYVVYFALRSGFHPDTVDRSGLLEFAVAEGLFVEQGLFVVLFLSGAVVTGILIFWIPQLAIHAMLVEAKRKRLSAIDDEYDEVLRRCRAESGSADHLSTELEVIEARRQNAKEIRTWSYNVPSLIPPIGAGLASVAGLVLQLIQVLSRSGA